MRKELKIIGLIGAVSIMMGMLSGCQTVKTSDPIPVVEEAGKHFVGGNIIFDYNPDVWNITKLEEEDSYPIITLYNQINEALISIVVYACEDSDAEPLFNEIREAHSEFKIMDEKLNTSKKGEATLSFRYEDTAEEASNHYIYAKVFYSYEDYNIAVLSTYNQESDFDGIDLILETLKYTKKSKMDDMLKTLKKNSDLAKILDDYLFFHYGKGKADPERTDPVKADPDSIKLDKTFHIKEGYDYLSETEIMGYSGNVYKILAPEVNGYNGEYLYYDDHGIYMGIDSMYNYFDSMEAYMNDTLEFDLEWYHENKRDYKNIQQSDIEETSDGMYQIVQVDHVSIDSEITTHTMLYYIKSGQDQDIIAMQIELDPAFFDMYTNDILEELSRYYEISMDEYGVDSDDLTYGGKLVDSGAKKYKYDGTGTEVRGIEGFPLIGETVLSNGDYEFTVYVPRGRETHNSGGSIYFNMYGVRGSFFTQSNYSDKTCQEYAMETALSDHQNKEESTKYYQDLSEIELVSGLQVDMAVAYFTSNQILADESKAFTHHMVISLDLGEGYIGKVSLELNTDEFSKETIDLLQQYGELIGIDFEIILDGMEGWQL